MAINEQNFGKIIGSPVLAPKSQQLEPIIRLAALKRFGEWTIVKKYLDSKEFVSKFRRIFRKMFRKVQEEFLEILKKYSKYYWPIFNKKKKKIFLRNFKESSTYYEEIFLRPSYLIDLLRGSKNYFKRENGV